MAISAAKTWVAGEVLTASDLNNEFINVYSNGETLGWPATISKNFAGNVLILSSDGNTTLTADTPDRLDLALSGTDLFRWDGTVATPVNGLDFIAGASGSSVGIKAVSGTDSNIDINLIPKGTGAVEVSGSEIFFQESDQHILSSQVFG
jgi:hypothetical protein